MLTIATVGKPTCRVGSGGDDTTGPLADVENGNFSEVVKRTYNESLELSEEWDDHFRSFWDLTEDFTFDLAED